MVGLQFSLTAVKKTRQVTLLTITKINAIFFLTSCKIEIRKFFLLGEWKSMYQK